jgi:hypothetical protein
MNNDEMEPEYPASLCHSGPDNRNTQSPTTPPPFIMLVSFAMTTELDDDRGEL